MVPLNLLHHISLQSETECLVRFTLNKALRSHLHQTQSIPTSIEMSHHSTLYTDQITANELKQCSSNESILHSIQLGSNSSRCDPVHGHIAANELKEYSTIENNFRSIQLAVCSSVL